MHLFRQMALTSIGSVIILFCVGITRADQRKSFVKYENNSAVSALAVNVVSSASVRCARDCLRRNRCLAFSVSSSSCILYDTYMDNPTIQLTTHTDKAFYKELHHEKISITTENTSDQNGGWPNFFPQLRINKVGHVLKWQVRCGSAGVVVLAIWRGEITPFVVSSIKLVGKHYITVQGGMQNQPITYDVPVEETVLVEPGDFVGFHYVNSKPKAFVKIIKDNKTPEGDVIEKSYGMSINDNQVPIGATVDVSGPGTPRAPSLALYIV